jgi:outer membrane lipoprotein LolB
VKSLPGGLVLAMLVAGCATRPVLDSPQPVPGAQFDVAQYPLWELRGRVSLVQGGQGWHAGMHWHEADGHYRLNLSGPLGQGAVRIEGQAGGLVRVQTADGREYTARNADALIEATTGWRLPVSGIRYWVRGVPAPGAQARESRDPRGRLAQLAQAGWEIHYTGYEPLAGRDWPTRLQMDRPDVSVKVVVDEWQVSRTAGTAGGP